MSHRASAESGTHISTHALTISDAQLSVALRPAAQGAVRRDRHSDCP